jgi:predicted nucleotidyltransferase
MALATPCYTVLVDALPREIRELAQAYRALLDREFAERLLSVIVFGSQARGDAGPESDLDLSVLIADLSESDRTRAVQLAFEAWWSSDRRGPLIAPAVWSDLEYGELLAAERRIALDIQREGVPV